MKSRRTGNQIPNMQQHGNGTHGIAAHPEKTPARVKRNVEKNRREQAQHGKTNRNDGIRDGVAGRHRGHSDKRSKVPKKGKCGRNRWQ